MVGMIARESASIHVASASRRRARPQGSDTSHCSEKGIGGVNINSAGGLVQSKRLSVFPPPLLRHDASGLGDGEGNRVVAPCKAQEALQKMQRLGAVQQLPPLQDSIVP